MLDYEIIGYEVEYHRVGACSSTSVKFNTEEEAIDFIKECRNRWDEYRLIKTQTAVIEF